MVNPYQAPQSDIDNGIVEPKSKKGWKIYFWCILVLHLLITASMLIDPDDESTLIDYVITFVISPVIILGAFGYAYSKRFLTAGFWKIGILVALISDAYSLSDAFTMDHEFSTDWLIYIYIFTLLVIVIPLLFFQYLCLYGYTYKSPEIWRGQNEEQPPA